MLAAAKNQGGGAVQEPSLTRNDAAGSPRGVVLMLHGGQDRSHARVLAASL